MEVSVSFTDGSEIKDPEVFDEDRTEIGRAFIAKDRVLITGDLCVRYEKYPWIEKLEVDGAKAAPAKRTGIGTKDARGFVKSLSTIYSRAYDEYYEFGGKADSAADFDAEGYFIHAAEYFLGISRDACIGWRLSFCDSSCQTGTTRKTAASAVITRKRIENSCFFLIDMNRKLFTGEPQKQPDEDACSADNNNC